MRTQVQAALLVDLRLQRARRTITVSPSISGAGAEKGAYVERGRARHRDDVAVLRRLFKVRRGLVCAGGTVVCSSAYLRAHDVDEALADAAPLEVGLDHEHVEVPRVAAALALSVQRSPAGAPRVERRTVGPRTEFTNAGNSTMYCAARQRARHLRPPTRGTHRRPVVLLPRVAQPCHERVEAERALLRRREHVLAGRHRHEEADEARGGVRRLVVVPAVRARAEHRGAERREQRVGLAAGEAAQRRVWSYVRLGGEEGEGARGRTVFHERVEERGGLADAGL